MSASANNFSTERHTRQYALSFAAMRSVFLQLEILFFGIGLAVLVHEGSTVVVVINALRLLGYRANEKEPRHP